jgi:plastocyanin
MKRAFPTTFASLILLGLLAAPTRLARATPAAPPPPMTMSPAELTAEVARLQAQVKEQRGLILQLVRVEQEHYDLLVRLVSGKGAEGAAAAPPPPAETPEQEPAEAKGPAAPHGATRTATLRGKINFPGGSMKDVYVYVENVKAAPAHGKTAEVAQRDKQFVPEVLVVQRGTKVSFPNYDSVFHNVFSPSTPHPFDLGSYRVGEPTKSVDLTSPGVVEVFCNVHARMHSNILVVPNALYARVGADGSFELPAVPVGARKLVAWSPHSKAQSQMVELGAQGAELSLTLQPQAPAAHNNKLGQPYGSYKD